MGWEIKWYGKMIRLLWEITHGQKFFLKDLPPERLG